MKASNATRGTFCQADQIGSGCCWMIRTLLMLLLLLSLIKGGGCGEERWSQV